jgi:hypothetical protein
MSPRTGARGMAGWRGRGSRGSHPGLRDVAPFRGSEWCAFEATSPRSDANSSRCALRSAESDLDSSSRSEISQFLATGLTFLWTRNGRILFSFGNWIAVFADHSCRQGIRWRMPDFHPLFISEFQPLIVRSRTWHFFGLPGWGVPASLGPRAGNRQKEWGISLWERKKAQESAMSEEPRRSTETQIDLAVAQGAAIAIWARTMGAPRRTAFRWAKEGSARRSSLIRAARSIRGSAGSRGQPGQWTRSPRAIDGRKQGGVGRFSAYQNRTLKPAAW